LLFRDMTAYEIDQCVQLRSVGSSGGGKKIIEEVPFIFQQAEQDWWIRRDYGRQLIKTLIAGFVGLGGNCDSFLTRGPILFHR